MSNLSICIKGSNKILYFIKDCIKNNNNFIGSNIKLLGVKVDQFDFIWTDDNINIIEDNNSNFVDYDKTSNQLVPISENLSIDKITHKEYIESLKIRKQISDLNYQQIEQYIDNNVSDINSAKEILKMFGKVILSLCKQIDYNI